MANMQTATLAAGCFWGVEELLRNLPGVTNTEVGYTGGTTLNPTYETVKTGTTGHAESIQVEFDADTISFSEILDFFFSMHDPTTIDQQGNDVGSQYRSEIFYHSEEQKTTAEQVIAAWNASGKWQGPIVTKLSPVGEFYPAEGYHQDYLQKNPIGLYLPLYQKVLGNRSLLSSSSRKFSKRLENRSKLLV